MYPAINLDTNAGAQHRPSLDRRLIGTMSSMPTANGKPYIEMDIGYRYHGVWIDYAATTLALSSMTFNWSINGSKFQTYTGDQRDSWNQHDRLLAASANTGSLFLPFMRMGMKDYREAFATSINTGAQSRNTPQAPNGVDSLRLDMVFDGNPSAIAKFDVYALTSACNPEQSTVVEHIDQWTETLGTSGTGVINKFARRLSTQGDATHQYLKRLWLQDTAAHLTRLTMTVNGDDVHDFPTALTNIDAQDQGVRTPQSGWQFWDGGMWGEGDRLIDLYNNQKVDVRVTAVTGASSPLTIVTETLGPAH
ncbi:MAG TPA: major capsid protein P2 [Rhizomicrobium sp.]